MNGKQKKPDFSIGLFNIMMKDYSSVSSKILFGRNFSLIPNVIQNGTMNPNVNNSNQNANPPKIKNNTIPKTLISCFFE